MKKNVVLFQNPGYTLCENIDPDIFAIWLDFVRLGEHRSKNKLQNGVDNFLAHTLIHFFNTYTEILSRSNGINYLRATTESSAGSRNEKELEKAGEMCILLAGLYRSELREMEIAPSYFTQLGQLIFNRLVFVFEKKQQWALAKLYKKVSKELPLMVQMLTLARDDIPREFAKTTNSC